MRQIFSIANAVFAISAGLIVLLGAFIPAAASLRLLFLQWAVLLSGMAVLVGVANLFSVHLQKITRRKKGSLYSLILLIFMILSLLVSSVDSLQGIEQLFVDAIIVPVETSLMALLAVTLLYASVRLLKKRPSLPSALFLLTAFLVLLGIAPLPFIGPIPFLSDGLRPLLTDTLASGGARGILIGVALGALFTGLRILLGADQPYGGK
jgi:hypothetical protein